MTCLKESIIIPKKENVSDKNNYRSIFLLPVLSKVFEKLLLQQILVYLEQINIVSEHQFGFRKKFIYCHLDLSKAFDTRSHELLINKLKIYNLDFNSITLINSYLHDRTQRVNLNGILSQPLTVRHGVPQGSILGPLLFLLYINDLAYTISTRDKTLYADDTTVGQADSDLNKL